MTVTLDLSGDWAVFDNPIAIRITNPDDTYADTSIAIKEGVEYTVMGNYRVYTCTFHVFKAQLGTFIPRTKAFVTDSDGVVWTVGHVDLQTLATRYVLSTTMQVGIAVK